MGYDLLSKTLSFIDTIYPFASPCFDVGLAGSQKSPIRWVVFFLEHVSDFKKFFFANLSTTHIVLVWDNLHRDSAMWHFSFFFCFLFTGCVRSISYFRILFFWEETLDWFSLYTNNLLNEMYSTFNTSFQVNLCWTFVLNAGFSRVFSQVLELLPRTPSTTDITVIFLFYVSCSLVRS